VIAPYLDPELSFFLHQRSASKWFGGMNMYGLMVKIKDESAGKVLSDGSIRKNVTENDRQTLQHGIDIAKRILVSSGARADSIVVTSPRGAHPGGTAAIGQVIDNTLRVRETANLYVADSSVFPASLGKPPIVAIMAVGKKLARSMEV
jgi:choline dehydrogenase-like flavoprotein